MIGITKSFKIKVIAEEEEIDIEKVESIKTFRKLKIRGSEEK